MRLKEKETDLHMMVLDDRREALRIARALRLWSLSGLYLAINSSRAKRDDLAIYIDTANLEFISERLRPASAELKLYLGQATLSTEAIVERITFPDDDWPELLHASGS
jgi:hypothetical protein